MDFFFWKKKADRVRCFFIKRRPLKKKAAPAVGFIQKDTSRTITTSSIGGPGTESLEKFGSYDIKVLVFSLHFPMDKFAAQLTSPLAAWVASLAVFVGSTMFKRRRFTKLGRIWRHKYLQKPTLCAAKLSSVVDIFKEPFSKGGWPIFKRRPNHFQKATV